MKRERIIAIAVAAILLGTFFYFYATYYSPPFSQKWSTDLGQSEIGIQNQASGDGNYYFLEANYTVMPHAWSNFWIKAVNETDGNVQWTTPVREIVGPIALSGNNYGFITNTYPRVSFYHGSVYMISYDFNYSAGDFSGSSSNISVTVMNISASNGAVRSVNSLNYTLNTYWIPTGIHIVGGNFYFGYRNDSSYSTQAGVVAAKLTDGKLIWNTTVNAGGYNGGPVYDSNMFATSSHIAFFVNSSNEPDLYSISPVNGNIIFKAQLQNITTIGGVDGNNLVYEVEGANSSNVIAIRSLSTNSTSYAATDYFGPSWNAPAISAIGNRIILYRDTNVTAYSFNGSEAWAHHLPKAGSDNYLTGFTGEGSGTVLYWSAVGGFQSDGSGIDYSVMYNSFAKINLTTGRIMWHRSYAPLSSVLNHEGTSYIPLAVNDGTMLFYWYSSNGDVHIGSAGI